ncbi:UDP-N-acetylmuramoyl-L-alanine--D-glutamate ligase [Rhodococcus marinonascens]|uniref:UDP-N-acetylmuramoyl-L-alanine--D-glutamate ligase n=1 Tax=Rhodococcus marinonascens TaxID=38311 RepID=UPI000933B7E1|nr:UDP-N-acetylmuramoyl-L-alanine--D-glutamate ligase [Rhodococcus marinonascens]
MAEERGELDWLHGRRVLVAGAGISGRATIEPLNDLGAFVTVTDSDVHALAACARIGATTVPLDNLLPDRGRIAEFALVVASPGFRPDAPLLSLAAREAVPVWGDIELSWRVDRAGLYGRPRRWLVVTGTNGKTTTTSMLHAILEAAGLPSLACGNIGLPVLDALRKTTPRAEVLAVELSSFQLHWTQSVRPTAGVILNIAEDHLDWHGGMQAYIDAKSRALSGEVAVLGLDDAVASSLFSSSPAPRTLGFRLGVPASGELGVEDGYLLDRAFADGERLAPAEGIIPPGPAGLMDALAAAALARAVGVTSDAVADGLATHVVGPHRAESVAVVGGVTFVDDSKATNPHAARSSILAHERVVWIAGGLLKGARVDDLVQEVAGRLSGAVLLGLDAVQIAESLSRHAPEVPVVGVETGDDTGVIEVPRARGAQNWTQTAALRVVLPPDTDGDALMGVVVREAAAMAAAGDAVVLAPAAASLDMFDNYGHRGRSFADAVGALDESDISRKLR